MKELVLSYMDLNYILLLIAVIQFIFYFVPQKVQEALGKYVTKRYFVLIIGTLLALAFWFFTPEEPERKPPYWITLTLSYTIATSLYEILFKPAFDKYLSKAVKTVNK